MNAKTLITNAARFIEERGHCKYDLQNSKGQVCMYGAMYLAATNGEHAGNGNSNLLHNAAFEEADDLLNRACPEIEGFIDWNNAKERTQKEVTDFMHEVAGTHDHHTTRTGVYRRRAENSAV